MHEVTGDSYVPKADLLLLIFILLIYLGACGTIHLSEAFILSFFPLKSVMVFLLVSDQSFFTSFAGSSSSTPFLNVKFLKNQCWSSLSSLLVSSLCDLTVCPTLTHISVYPVQLR